MANNAWQLVADDLCCIEPGAGAAELAEALRDTGDWLDVVCGRDTVFVQFDIARVSASEALTKLESFDPGPNEQADAAEAIEIPACYDPAVAPDLVAVCEQLGLSVEQFVEAHTSAAHTVAMLGFMPGFTYIDGLDPSLHIDRHDQPRQHVDIGSIGIAGSQTGIYPNDGPGGWRLIARTPLQLFDPTKSPPALFKPMQSVRFVPITLDEFEASR